MTLTTQQKIGMFEAAKSAMTWLRVNFGEDALLFTLHINGDGVELTHLVALEVGGLTTSTDDEDDAKIAALSQTDPYGEA
jgi:hypothetical protein